MAKRMKRPAADDTERYWRIETADRVALLIDCASYFSFLYQAFCRAKRSIFIVGWELDPETRLYHDPEPRELPASLGALLEALVEREPELVVRLLPWDYTPMGLGSSLLAPLLGSKWPSHERLYFQPVEAQSPGASNHQKIVVVDDSLAFCGGMDLTSKRWDTRQHLADDARRRDHRGEPYNPWHDVQVAVDGDAARALGDVCRSIWLSATGETLEDEPKRAGSDPWPPGLDAELENTPVGISRTRGENDHAAGSGPVREIEALYVHAIREARRFIYVENQYLTSFTIGEALCERLDEVDGPEVVLVLPAKSEGWLEEGLMSALRVRVLNRLEHADRYNRLRVYSPVVPNLEDGHVDVHSKVLIVDGKLVSIGSANVSNRSMTLDSECNVTIEAGRSRRRRAAIGRILHRLLAEHLDCTEKQVETSLPRRGSLIATIDHLSRPQRNLAPLSNDYPDWIRKVAPSSSLTDPEGPVDLRRVTEGVIPGRVSDLTNDPMLKLAIALSGFSIAGLWWAFRKMSSLASEP